MAPKTHPPLEVKHRNSNPLTTTTMSSRRQSSRMPSYAEIQEETNHDRNIHGQGFHQEERHHTSKRNATLHKEFIPKTPYPSDEYLQVNIESHPTHPHLTLHTMFPRGISSTDIPRYGVRESTRQYSPHNRVNVPTIIPTYMKPPTDEIPLYLLEALGPAERAKLEQDEPEKLTKTLPTSQPNTVQATKFVEKKPPLTKPPSTPKLKPPESKPSNVPSKIISKPQPSKIVSKPIITQTKSTPKISPLVVPAKKLPPPPPAEPRPIPKPVKKDVERIPTKSGRTIAGVTVSPSSSVPSEPLVSSYSHVKAKPKPVSKSKAKTKTKTKKKAVVSSRSSSSYSSSSGSSESSDEVEPEGLSFEFRPNSPCCTEVTLTIEPDDDEDPLEYAVNNGIMPIVCCMMPPCYVMSQNWTRSSPNQSYPFC